MVIIRATKGCQHHDSRLHIGKFMKTLRFSGTTWTKVWRAETSSAISMWQGLQLFSVHFFAPQSIIFHFRPRLSAFRLYFHIKLSLFYPAGTRICVNCPKFSTNVHHLENEALETEDQILEANCSELTQTPIRRFRLSSHCHGKLTFLAPNPSSSCSCGHGLHFRLIPEQ